MVEYFCQCPYCWESISVLIDTSISDQNYVEDCEVCCNPIDFNVSCSGLEIRSVEVCQLGQ
ncbi:CPXCG motif-containing cysteine-rich protein [Robiginitalea aurantiaca]|uniref:CPXCG motif-containing cysteine-rich protein n=1 Tax=Robiginitalea aurantiaca TaxID=3056915 RepID=UPI003EC10988